MTDRPEHDTEAADYGRSYRILGLSPEILAEFRRALPEGMPIKHAVAAILGPWPGDGRSVTDQLLDRTSKATAAIAAQPLREDREESTVLSTHIAEDLLADVRVVADRLGIGVGNLGAIILKGLRGSLREYLLRYQQALIAETGVSGDSDDDSEAA